MNSENINRLQIRRMVALFPGAHLRMLSRLVGVSQSTTLYHVNNLARDGEISCWKEGGYLRAYPPWVEDERTRRIYAVLQQKSAREILRILCGGSKKADVFRTNGSIAESTGLSRSTVSEYMSTFRDLQVAKRVATEDGLAFRIEEGEKERLVLILQYLDRNFIERATDSYLELWEI
jgi:predicted transcriptional regulator